MTDIEIPFPEDRNKTYRFFEILPAFLSWSFLLLPVVLSIINPTIAAYFIIGYLVFWFAKALGMNVRVVQGYRRMRHHQKLDWELLAKELDESVEMSSYATQHSLAWHPRNIARRDPNDIKSANVIHELLIAVYNESIDVIEPTIEAIVHSHYDLKKVIVIIAYEERGGPESEATVKHLINKYGHNFLYADAIRHPKDIKGEVIGKGGNITYAARETEIWMKDAGIDFRNVVITTLDSDNRVDPMYLAALTYAYVACIDRDYCSFQPILIYNNNIWDVPAPMRVIATGNSIWTMVQSLRPHLLRNFSSHAQGLVPLIHTNYWSVRTIVEDGHQFWRTYFAYDGMHEVIPVFVPIYQDAVLSSTIRKTLKAQFIQLRRWAWGASDIAYVATKGYFHKNKVSKIDLTFKFCRLVENHVSWAAAPLILAFSALIPSLVKPGEHVGFIAYRLPIVASRIQTVAMAGILLNLYLSFKVLPPKPKRYKAHRNLGMILQWVFLPFTSICYYSFAGFYSQTRLALGKYIGKFDLTEKVVKK